MNFNCHRHFLIKSVVWIPHIIRMFTFFVRKLHLRWGVFITAPSIAKKDRNYVKYFWTLHQDFVGNKFLLKKKMTKNWIWPRCLNGNSEQKAFFVFFAFFSTHVNKSQSIMFMSEINRSAPHDKCWNDFDVETVMHCA